MTFHFSTIDWQSPQQIRYSYRIEDIDPDWSAPSARPFADYRNLPYGDHVFELRAIGIAQKWSETFTYPFTIRPPWWLSWWAFAAYALLSFLLLRWIYLYQLRRQLAISEAARLQEMDEAKSRLITNVTHEFRTPLTIILGMARKMKEEPGEWFRKGVDAIQRNGEKVLGLVNQMLDLARLESGRLEPELQLGDVTAYLGYRVQAFQSMAGAKNIDLRFERGPGPVEMDYDPDWLGQILDNLLSNALKFTQRGGTVIVKAFQQADHLVLTVRDNGPGISPEQLPHLFDRFYQADGSSTRKGEGTGIGLALVKELSEKLGGTISAESHPGDTIFCLSLPISRKAPPAEPFSPGESGIHAVAPLVHPPDSGGEEERPLVLLVEDNADVARYTGACLEGEYRLVYARDGREGIDKAFQFIPDLIVSDVMMPRVDGFELLEQLKADPRTSHIPILLLTAKADVESKLKGLQAGAEAYLPKPFMPEELEIRLQSLLEQRRRLQAWYIRQAGIEEKEPGTAEDLPNQSREQEFLLRLRGIVEANLSNNRFTVDQLSSELYLDSSTLYRKLKALTGKSPNRYIRALRVARAKKLLREPGQTVTAVAIETGFSSVKYFSRVFRKEVGVPPSEFSTWLEICLGASMICAGSCTIFKSIHVGLFSNWCLTSFFL